MPAFLNQLIERAKNFWSRISISQRVLVSSIAAGMVGLFFVLMLVMNTTEMVPLYTELSPEDANSIVKELEAQKVKFKLDHGGSTIMVPEDQVYNLRIKIAGEGNISGKNVGFAIFDEIKVGETPFVQRIKYQRALQGELERTIMAFPAIEHVRVHLVIPQSSLFIEEQQKPSVSVALSMKKGKQLDNSDILAIVNLVTMSVEGLTKERVSITDTSGKTLFQPEEEGSMFGLASVQFEHRMQTQQNLERRIEELLIPVVGHGRVIAKVNADLDFSQKTIKKESYDPNVVVVRSEKRMEESTQGQANLEAGVPEINFRGDGLTGSVSTQSSNREQRETNNEINKVEENIIGSIGDVSRLTVAVIVDGTYKKNDAGEMVAVPRSNEELQAIRQLVSQAVGFDSSRGDQIEVRYIPFGAPETYEQDLASIIADYTVRLGKPFLNALLILIFLLVVVRPVIMAMIRPKVEGEMLEELAGLPTGEERLALTESSEEELDAMAILEKIEDIKAHALHLSEQNMEQALGIIRSWLKADTAADKQAKAA